MMYRLEAVDRVLRKGGIAVGPTIWSDDLDAIEAAAVAEERARLRAAVEGMQRNYSNDEAEWRSKGAEVMADCCLVAVACFGAVLALVDPEPHRCNCPESGTSGSCPFHDSSTIR